MIHVFGVKVHKFAFPSTHTTILVANPYSMDLSGCNYANEKTQYSTPMAAKDPNQILVNQHLGRTNCNFRIC